MLVLCFRWQNISSFFIDANFCDFRALCVQLTQHTAGCYQCQESYSPHMATASRITPKRESEQLWRNSQRGIQGDNFLVGLLKYFSLKYPIRRLDWFAYPILTHVYVLHYINTLNEDFVVHFEEKQVDKICNVWCIVHNDTRQASSVSTSSKRAQGACGVAQLKTSFPDFTSHCVGLIVAQLGSHDCNPCLVPHQDTSGHLLSTW